MAEPRLQIRIMTATDLELALDWAAAEGWNPGIHDGEAFRGADLEGFLIGEIEGEPIGSVSAVRYGERFGFLGFYIVKPERRGQGYGIQLWRAGLEHLQGRVLGLDGVIPQIDNYRKFDFQISHRHIRHQGTGQVGERDPAAVPLTEIPWEQLQEYDRDHFGYARPAFLEAWIRLNWGYAWVESGELQGYGVIRACREGFKIGPLFADSPQIADRLFQTLRITAADQPVYLDIPDRNLEAQALVQCYGMQPVFECARMYAGEPPQVNLQQIYGVTSLELG